MVLLIVRARSHNGVSTRPEAQWYGSETARHHSGGMSSRMNVTPTSKIGPRGGVKIGPRGGVKIGPRGGV